MNPQQETIGSGKVDWHHIKIGLGLGIAVFVGWMESLPAVVQYLLGAMFVDLALGIIRALSSRRKRKFDLNKSFRSMGKKAGVILLIGLTYLMEKQVKLPLSSMAAVFYACHYSVSAIDNAVGIGLPVPDWLRDTLTAMERNASPPESE